MYDATSLDNRSCYGTLSTTTYLVIQSRDVCVADLDKRYFDGFGVSYSDLHHSLSKNTTNEEAILPRKFGSLSHGMEESFGPINQEEIDNYGIVIATVLTCICNGN